MNINKISGLFLLLLTISISCQQVPKQQKTTEDTAETSEQAWIQKCDPNDEGACGFATADGALKIPYGKYPMIFTDTFTNYAIVVSNESGIIGIDKAENVLYQVFVFDNGPDYAADGYFRIVKDGKIGFADVETGEIKIAPQYTAARPFKHGYAAICPDCISKKDGEYTSWVDGKWGIMDKQGNVVVAPAFDNITSIEENGKAAVVKDGVEAMIDITTKE